MSLSHVEGQTIFQYDKCESSERISGLIPLFLTNFGKEIKSYVYFHLILWFLLITEVSLFLLFFSFLANSSLLSVMLAALFFTGFSYLILRVYLQAQKPEQFFELRQRYIEECKKFLKYQEGIVEHHMSLANACSKLAAALQGKEYHYYPFISRLHSSSKPLAEKFSCWWHWHDVHEMKELLLQYAIEEHIRLVRCEPTSLELHAALANAYVMLSGLYIDPRKMDGGDEERWIPHNDYETILRKKFRVTAERAIEEFRILSEYAPNDPWVHAQLAYSYHDLQMPEEEIREYETILKLRPDDKETLFKLGMLYFHQGYNARGLQVYAALKNAQYSRSDDLIQKYGEPAMRKS